MWNRKKLYGVLASAGALVLLLGGLGGASVVSAQEVTPDAEDAPIRGYLGWGRGPLGLGSGGDWTTFDAVAEELELTPEALFSRLHDGESLDEIADEQGVDLDAVQKVLKAMRDEAVREAIQRAVEDGDMSREQADWMLEGLEQGYMPRGRGFGHGFGRDGRASGARGGVGRPDQPSESSGTRTPNRLNS